MCRGGGKYLIFMQLQTICAKKPYIQAGIDTMYDAGTHIIPLNKIIMLKIPFIKIKYILTTNIGR